MTRFFFGFPVWWYDLPMPMWTFLESYDFAGKTIIPFTVSHEGTSNGGSAFQNMKELARMPISAPMIICRFAEARWIPPSRMSAPG